MAENTATTDNSGNVTDQNTLMDNKQDTDQTTDQTDQDTDKKDQTDQTDQTTDSTVKAEGAPESYEFVPPEGQKFNPGFIDAYAEVAKKLDLSQEKAQTLIDEMTPVLQKQQIDQLNAVRAQWTEASNADAEFGGDKLDESMAVAKKALEKFGSQELNDLLNTTGFGNHPEIIRFFYRTGKAISEDTFVGGHKEGKPGPMDFNQMADKLYK